MRVLVTGAGGFIGREVVRRLDGAGHELIAFDSRLDGVAADFRIEGDLAEPSDRRRALDLAPEAVIHLAALPGGAAEADPALSRVVNLEATLDLLNEVSGVRWINASTIAVFGDPLPECGVDDHTPVYPRLVYGLHKAMIEQAVGALSRRGQIDGLSIRLPGVVARPRGAVGMKSAFMSDVFHALIAQESYVAPVGPEASLWLMSLSRAAEIFERALDVELTAAPKSRVVTAPALRVRFADLAAEIARQLGREAALGFEPDAALQAAFGANPTLSTPAAERLGLGSAETTIQLVERALTSLNTVVKEHRT